MSTKPLVSVILPSYNHAPYLRECLDSVLAQTHTQLEIVAIDGGSTDGSWEILTEYAARNPGRVRAYSNTTPKMYVRFNEAIAKSKGEFIALQCTDDVWLPHKLETQLALMARAGAKACYSTVVCIDKASNVITAGDGNAQQMGTPPGDDLIRELILNPPVIPAPTLIFSKDLFRSSETPYEEDLLYADWVLGVKVALRTDVVYSAEPLANYRLHDTNTTHPNSLSRRHVDDHLAALSFMFDSGMLDAHKASLKSLAYEHVATRAVEMAVHSYNLGERGQTLRNLRYAAKTAPIASLSMPKFYELTAKTIIGRHNIKRCSAAVKSLMN